MSSCADRARERVPPTLNFLRQQKGKAPLRCTSASQIYVAPKAKRCARLLGAFARRRGHRQIELARGPAGSSARTMITSGDHAQVHCADRFA